MSILSAILFSFVNFGAQAVSDCDNPIKLRFEKDSMYFEEVTAGEKLKFTYKFEVTGCDSLQIHQVYTGCSCTSPFYSDRKLGPGDTGEINLVFDSKDWGADTGRLVEKLVYVMYTGGSQAVFFKGIVSSKR